MSDFVIIYYKFSFLNFPCCLRALPRPPVRGASPLLRTRPHFPRLCPPRCDRARITPALPPPHLIPSSSLRFAPPLPPLRAPAPPPRRTPLPRASPPHYPPASALRSLRMAVRPRGVAHPARCPALPCASPSPRAAALRTPRHRASPPPFSSPCAVARRAQFGRALAPALPSS